MYIKYENVKSKFIDNFAKMKVMPSASLVETANYIRQRSFAITGLTNLEILSVVKNILLEAMKQEMSYAFFKKNISLFFEQSGIKPLPGDRSTFRWDVIYRTNLKTVFEYGRFEAMQNIADMYPYREFVAVDDERTTTICRELNGAIARYDSPLYLNNQVPRHFNCRSTWIISVDPSPKDIKLWEGKNLRSNEGFGVFTGPLNLIDNEKIQKRGEIQIGVKGEIEKEKIPDWNKIVGRFEKKAIKLVDKLKTTCIESDFKKRSEDVMKFEKMGAIQEIVNNLQNWYKKYYTVNFKLENGLMSYRKLTNVKKVETEEFRQRLENDAKRLPEELKEVKSIQGEKAQEKIQKLLAWSGWSQAEGSLSVYCVESFTNIRDVFKRLELVFNGYFSSNFCQGVTDLLTVDIKNQKYSIVFDLDIERGVGVIPGGTKGIILEANLKMKQIEADVICYTDKQIIFLIKGVVGK